MEHIVIRNAGLNNATRISLGKDMEFTQTAIGRSPFRLDHEGRPVDVRVGDRLFIAQAGYGVIGSSRIAEVSQRVSIARHEDIDALRKRYPSLEATYWESLRDSMLKARERSKALQFVGVRATLERAYPDEEQFPLNRARGEQSSWVVLDTSARKERVFARRGVSVSATLAERTEGDYGSIPDKVRWAVTAIWKGANFGERKPGEALHYDHFVPKALGGPGILAENVIPLPKSLNLAKKHLVVRGFAMVAHEWGLLTTREAAAFDSSDQRKTPAVRQARLTKRVTKLIRSRPLSEQRRFYFAVLERSIDRASNGKTMRSLFAEAGALPPGT